VKNEQDNQNEAVKAPNEAPGHLGALGIIKPLLGLDLARTALYFRRVPRDARWRGRTKGKGEKKTKRGKGRR
jgi:hypothetical protein